MTTHGNADDVTQRQRAAAILTHFHLLAVILFLSSCFDLIALKQTLSTDEDHAV